MGKFVLVLSVLLVIFTTCIQSQEVSSYLFDCKDESRALHYKVAERIELCCTISSQFQDCFSDPSLMSIRSSIKRNDWTMTNHPNSTVNLTIPSPNLADSGLFSCLCNGSIAHSRSVYIIGEVDAPEIFSVVSKMKGTITVYFNPGTTNHTFTNNFTVFMNEMTGRDDSVLCGNKSIKCWSKQCKCIGRTELLLDRNVTITVSKMRSVQEQNTSIRLNLIEHIKPERVRDLYVRAKTAHSAVLELCAPQKAWMLIRFMEIRNRPLKGTVVMIKTQGYYEERKFTITFNDEYRVCLQVPLLQLVAFTKYSLSVTAVGGGGSGKSKEITFTTKRDVPLSPPYDIFYWITQNSSRSNSNCPENLLADFQAKKLFSINVNWQPLPHDFSGGNVYYEVIVWDVESRKIYSTNVTETNVMIKCVSGALASVEIYAINERGRSSNYSVVAIEKDAFSTKIAQLESHLEIGQDQAKILIKDPPSGVKVSSIYACLVDHNPDALSHVRCKGSLQKVTSESALDYKDDLIDDVLSIRQRKCSLARTTVCGEIPFEFCDRKGKRSPAGNHTTVCVLKTTVQDSCSPFFEGDENYELSNIYKPLKQSGSSLKFLFSVTRDEKELPRLFPFNCYYDNRFDMVILKYSEFLVGGSVSLKWKQKCDFTTPQQFLVDSYRVYTSKDKKCPYSGNRITSVPNIVGKELLFKMPRQNIYACIESWKSSENITAVLVNSHYVNKHAVSEGDMNLSWIAAVVILLVFIFLCCGLFSCRKCRERKEKVRSKMSSTQVFLKRERVEKENEFEVETNFSHSYSALYDGSEAKGKDDIHNVEGDSGQTSVDYSLPEVDFDPRTKAMTTVSSVASGSETDSGFNSNSKTSNTIDTSIKESSSFDKMNHDIISDKEDDEKDMETNNEDSDDNDLYFIDAQIQAQLEEQGYEDS